MNQDTLEISYTIDSIPEVANNLWGFAKSYPVWTFSGDMGAGKTTLISALCKLLKVEEVVSSPTFSLINEYHFQRTDGAFTLYHMDWYRIESILEAIDAGIEDALTSGAYCFVEWPEKAAQLLPKQYVAISIVTVSSTERHLRAQHVAR